MSTLSGETRHFIIELDAALEAHMDWTRRVMRCAVLRATPGEDVLASEAHLALRASALKKPANPATYLSQQSVFWLAGLASHCFSMIVTASRMAWTSGADESGPNILAVRSVIRMCDSTSAWPSGEEPA